MRGCAAASSTPYAIAIIVNLSCNTAVRTIPNSILRTLLACLVCATCCAITYATPQFDQDQRPGLLPRLSLADPPATGSHDPPPVAKIIATQARSDQPLWHVDLHAIGFPTSNRAIQWQRGLGSFDTVDFLSEGVVAATFITEEPAAELQKRDDPNRRHPYRLHLIFLDAANGSVLKTLEWVGDDLKMGIFPRHDGSFLFFSTEHIVLYSTDWKPVKEIPLPWLQRPNASLKEIAESPSGNVLEVRIFHDESVSCLHIATDTLVAERDTCTTLLGFTVSDDAIATADTRRVFNLGGEIRDPHPVTYPRDKVLPNTANPYARVALSLERGDRKGILCDTLTVKSCWTPEFIANDMLVVHSSASVGLVDLSGIRKGESAALEFEKFFLNAPAQPSKGRGTADWVAGLGRPVRPSASGQRFAVALNQPVELTGGKIPADLAAAFIPAKFPDAVEVFDIPIGLNGDRPWLQCHHPDQACDWMIYRLTNVNNQFKQIWGLGLSPNGEKLVIDSGGVIQAYTIPEPKDAPTPKHK